MQLQTVDKQGVDTSGYRVMKVIGGLCATTGPALAGVVAALASGGYLGEPATIVLGGVAGLLVSAGAVIAAVYVHGRSQVNVIRAESLRPFPPPPDPEE
jgi:hypothetical protein